MVNLTQNSFSLFWRMKLFINEYLQELRRNGANKCSTNSSKCLDKTINNFKVETMENKIECMMHVPLIIKFKVIDVQIIEKERIICQLQKLV